MNKQIQNLKIKIRSFRAILLSRLKRFSFTLCILSFTLTMLGTAQAVMFPVKSAVNPLTQTIYTVNNGSSPASIYVNNYFSAEVGYSYNSSIVLPAGAKCYGLAVTPDGKQLLLSVNNGASSKLLMYPLDAKGIPKTTGSQEAAGWASVDSSPVGITVHPSGIIAYIIDWGTGKIHTFVYNYDAQWVYVQSTASNPDLYKAYDIAASDLFVYVSKKTDLGKIFVYATLLGAVGNTPVASIEGLSAPTFLKISPDGNRLYAAVNGSTGGDIKVFDITKDYNTPPYISNMKTISSSISGTYGWTAFDITPDEQALYYTQAQDQAETSTKIYKVNLPLTKVNLPLTQDTIAGYFASVPKSDGLIVSPDRSLLATTYSGDGSVYTVTGGTGLVKLAPVIESITPASATTGTGTTYLTIKGKYFTGPASSSGLPATLYLNAYVTKAQAIDYLVILKDIVVNSASEISATLDNSKLQSILQEKYFLDEPLSQKLGVKLILPNGEVLKPNLFEIKESPKAPAIYTDASSPLQQKQSNASGVESSLGAGATVESNSASLVFRFKITDPSYASISYPIKLTPRVTLKRTGDASRPPVFEGAQITVPKGDKWLADNVNHTAEAVVSVPLKDLAEGTYNWEADVKDEGDLFSPWVAFVGTKAVDYDFKIVKTPVIVVPAPVITKVYPNSVPENLSALPNPSIKINIKGDNFIAPVTVNFLGNPIQSTLIDEHTVSATITPAAITALASPNPYSLNITAAGGVSNNADFYITTANSDSIPPAQITDLKYQLNKTAGGYNVILNWTNPADKDIQTIKVLKASLELENDIKIDAAGKPGAAAQEILKQTPPEPGVFDTAMDAAVKTGENWYYAVYGMDTSGNWNTLLTLNSNEVLVNVNDANVTGPTVTSIDPNNSLVGQTVKIINLIGTNFDPKAVVSLTSSTNPTFNIQTSTILSKINIACTINIPNDPSFAGKWNMRVTNPDGQYGELKDGFTVYPQGTVYPTITKIEPNTAKQGDTVSTTISGTNFLSDASKMNVRLAFTGKDPIAGAIDATSINTASSPNTMKVAFKIPVDQNFVDPEIRDVMVDITDTGTKTAVLPGGFTISKGVPVVQTGEKSFNITYMSNDKAENWISIPFASVQNSGSNIVTRGDLLHSICALIDKPEAQDKITLAWRKNSTQDPFIAEREYDPLAVNGPDVDNNWVKYDNEKESQPITAGEMYTITIANPNPRPAISKQWTISGTIPNAGTINFNFVYQGNDKAENWISIPNSSDLLATPDLAKKGTLLKTICTKIVPAIAQDKVTLAWRNNATQDSFIAEREYDPLAVNGPDVDNNWVKYDIEKEGQPITLGDPFTITISNPGNKDNLNTQWP